MGQQERTYIAQTEDDLPGIAEKIIATAGNRKKFALNGDLGAGKTAFVKAFCRQLGVPDNVTSPTFSLVNEYTYCLPDGTERALHHLDLYRLNTLDEALGIGIEDYLYDDSYCLIEWPDLVDSILPEDAVHIFISILPDSGRKILILSGQD